MKTIHFEPATWHAQMMTKPVTWAAQMTLEKETKPRVTDERGQKRQRKRRPCAPFGP